MTRLSSQAARPLSAVFLVLFLLATPLVQAWAADAPAATSRADVEHLIKTIEDPVARQRLVGDLKLMVAADKGDQEVEEPGLLSLISTKVQDFSDELLATMTALSDVTKLADWAEQQLQDDHLRERWGSILGRLAAILGGGVLAEQLALLALSPPRRLLESRHPRNYWLRLPAALGRGLLDLLPVGVFLATSYGLLTLPVFKLIGDSSLAAVLLISAYALGRTILVGANTVFMPGAAGIRVLPVSDETATYLSIWARRLTFTTVWGYFALQAFKMLGLPKSGYAFSLKLLGLVVATLLVILVLQNRQTVATWIRSQGQATGLSGKVQGLRNRVADIWHVLAGLYILVAFLIWALQVKGGFEYVIQATAMTVAILFAAHVVSSTLHRLVRRAFAINSELRDQFPQLEARANRYSALMHSVVRGAAAVATVLAILQAWGADSLAWLGSDLGRHVLSSSVSIIAVLIGSVIAWELVSASIERYMSRTDTDGNLVERSARARTLLPLFRNVVMVCLVVVVTLIVLSELGINIAPLLAGAGVIGVAIGFGSQKLVQDVITGAFILFEDTIAIGDIIQIGTHSGSVESMTIRTLRLRDAIGQVHSIPFSSVSDVINMSRDFAFHQYDIGVSYRENVDEVMGAIKQIGDEMRADDKWGPQMVDDIEVFGVDKFADSAVIIRGRLKTLPGKQWAIGREFNRRVKNRFDELKIELPFPTTTMYFGQNRDGTAPAAQIHIVERSPERLQAPEVDAFSGDAVDFPIGESGT
ncbi:MAG TPA: mechanosensitive ion channel domain-containing protein, partial [Patescibacteria group bacterium]|nr:mechanosensitive ion channel domain-containing protein [Patescibacteria group bacterium]